MDPRPPSGSFKKKGCKNVPPEKANSMNFGHPQLPQNLFSQPAYAMNYPFPPFPHYPPYSQNFQYAIPPQYGPYSLRPPPGAMSSPYLPSPAMPSKAVSDQDTPHSVTGPGEHDVDNAETEKTFKRLMWTEEEDLRLITAWLINFKGDKHWEKIAAEYNSTTPARRRRELQHLKGHWHKIAKKLAHFNDCWCRVKAKYPSGKSENMQLMDKTWLMCKEEAHALYLEEVKRNFTLGHCWKAVWDQRKWKEYMSTLWTKRMMRSESDPEDYMSSSEESEDIPGKEIGQVFMTYKDGKVLASTSSSEVPENMKDHEDTTEVQPSVSNQQLLLPSSKQPDVRDKDTEISMKQSEVLTADVPWPMEFSLGSHQLIGDSSKLRERQQGMAVRHVMDEKESHPQGFEVLDHYTVARDHTSKKEIQARGFKSQKISRKRKGKASSSSCEVQEDIKHVIYLQKMLNNDREKMSEVQLRLSKEQLELARIKQEEAKERKEATVYKKYTELLLADTSKFDEFQKVEYERAVKHIGDMLFNKDDN